METITDEQYFFFCIEKFKKLTKKYIFINSNFPDYMTILINKYQNNSSSHDLNVLTNLKSICYNIHSQQEGIYPPVINCLCNLKNKCIWKDILLFFDDDALNNIETNNFILKINNLEDRVLCIEKNNSC